MFATFYEAEMQTVCNMVNMYKSDGTTVEVVENPYYNNKSLDTSEQPSMRYIILVSSI